MEVLVVGNGGREAALVWKISQSPLVEKVYCAPGSEGIARIPKAACVPIEVDARFGSHMRLADFARKEKIDLTVVGPEAPLVSGIVNLFETRKLKIVGPRSRAAQLEGSKVFARCFMEWCSIPAPNYRCFSDDNAEGARQHAIANLPCVIKPDGLTGGKGVMVCHTEEAVESAIGRILVKREFGEAGNQIVIEEFLEGEEATFMVLTDGKEAMPLLATQDHKALNDNDEGPNIGGMGAYAPAPIITPKLQKEIMDTIVYPTLHGMKELLQLYKGVLYVGLIITESGPKVLEFNCRFGDPELQPIVMLMESDIVPFLMGVAEGRLPKEKILFSRESAVCVVMTSEGYGSSIGPKVGDKIEGIEKLHGLEKTISFHAGTKLDRNGAWKTAGGRVLGITAKGKNIDIAIGMAYNGVSLATWKGEHHRTDIGKKALLHSGLKGF